MDRVRIVLMNKSIDSFTLENGLYFKKEFNSFLIGQNGTQYTFSKWVLQKWKLIASFENNNCGIKNTDELIEFLKIEF